MLLLDWGNTRLKWAGVKEGQVAPGGAVAHENRPQQALAEIRATPEAVWVASVANEAIERALREACAERWPEAPVHFARTRPHGNRVTCAYRDPAALGVDRWLAMVAARRLVDGPLTVMDAGSAVTLDAVDDDGTHFGGLILPGVGLARRLLREHTGRVNAGDGTQPAWWADNTADAVANGARLAAVALAERFHRRTAERAGAEATLVLTGGDAPAMMQLLAVPCDHEPALVLQGLAVVAESGVPAD